MTLASLPFEAVFAQSPIGEYLLSPEIDPVILAVNDTFLRACGRSRESLVGTRLFVAFPSDPTDSGDTGMAALRESLRRVVETGKADALPLQRYPIRVTRPDGSEAFEERFWHAVSAPIFDEQGRLQCIIHRTEDVTAQTRVAEALRASTDRERFQLRLADRLRPLRSPDEITSVAAAMLRDHLGIARVTYAEVDEAGSSFIQRHWTSSGTAEGAPGRQQLEDFGTEIIGALRAGEAVAIDDVATDCRTAAHVSAYARIDVRSSIAIPIVRSNRLGLVLSLQHNLPRAWSDADIQLAHEVAERTWAAAENARAQEELKENSKRKDEFLAMLAHELRNPLAPIRTAAALLMERRLATAETEAAGAIVDRQSRHMAELLDDLLDVSRVTQGWIVLQKSPHDMGAIVRSAIEQASPLIESRDHELEVDLPSEPAVVSGDGKRLVQVVSNLLNNAAKYTPTGGRIRVAVSVDRDQVRVVVEDNGVGIPRDLQPRVFDIFAQAERTPDRTQGGLGLGLALVKSLVELHGGAVLVSSEGRGRGSRFTVELPRVAASVNSTAANDMTTAASRPLDVLVLDDNVDAADMLMLLLESAGHRVEVEYDPLRALDTVSRRDFDVALVDIGLPSMDGFEVVRRMRARSRTNPRVCVALTGYGQAEDKGRALEAGFDEHLIKPAEPNQLLALLARAASPRTN